MQLPSSTILQNSLFISLLFLAQINEAVFTLPANTTVLALIAFGDSIVDPGNNNYLPATAFKANLPPYGKDLMDGEPTGRFSNGKIPTDFIAGELGINELLHAYLDPSITPTDLLTGVSFASGGSGYDPLTPKIAGVISLSDQLNNFRAYIEKLKFIAGVEKAESIINNAIYLVVAGSNDIANTYFSTPFRSLEYDVSSYTDLMIKEASSFIQDIYNMGARRIGVANAPPIGCVPATRTTGRGVKRQCIEKYNQAAIVFNSKLSPALDTLNSNFQNAKAIYVDIYTPLLNHIVNPTEFGFKVVDKGCCGTGTIEVGLLCNDLTSATCPDVSNYLFWDSFHLTQKAYEDLSITISQTYLKDIVCMAKIMQHSRLVERTDLSIGWDLIRTNDVMRKGGELDPIQQFIAGVGKAESIINNAVYLVVAGSNDIANTYFSMPFRRLEYDVSSYTDLMIKEASSFIQEIYNMGARRIGMANAPPVGCLPATRTINGGIKRQCIEKYNQTTILFNSKLSPALDTLNSNFQNAKAIYLDIYTPLLNHMLNPTVFGFKVVDKGCCGTGKIEVGQLCNDLTLATCPDVSNYLFWDSFHPRKKLTRTSASQSVKHT